MLALREYERSVGEAASLRSESVELPTHPTTIANAEGNSGTCWKGKTAQIENTDPKQRANLRKKAFENPRYTVPADDLHQQLVSWRDRCNLAFYFGQYDFVEVPEVAEIAMTRLGSVVRQLTSCRYDA